MLRNWLRKEKMTKKKSKILYNMAENPFWSKAGNLTRCLQMLSYFEDRNAYLDVTFFSSINWNTADEERFRKTFPSIKLVVESFKSSKSNRIKYFLTDKLPWMLKKFLGNLQVSRVSQSFKERFQQLVREEGFEQVIISYVEYAELVAGLDGVKKIVDTHDFFTLQKMQKNEEAKQLHFDKIFKEEIELLQLFDEIWTYSIEEQYIFNQFTNQAVELIPLSFAKPIRINQSRTYDLIYVASDNPHNIQSILWFVDSVLPKINGLTLHIFGKICRVVPDHVQIVKHGMVDDLDKVYQNGKIAICPMLSGTGIKIKVLEALSYGIPVVTNRRGVDGLVNKIQNGCVLAEDGSDFAQAIMELANDEKQYQQISKEGIDFYDSFYTQQKEWDLFDRKFIKR